MSFSVSCWQRLDSWKCELLEGLHYQILLLYCSVIVLDLRGQFPGIQYTTLCLIVAN
jgi:hypothetical protein